MRIILVSLLLCASTYAQQRAQRRQDHFRPQNQEYRDQQQEAQQNYPQFDQRFNPKEFDQNRQASYNVPPSPTTPIPIGYQESKITVTPIPIISFNKQQALDGSYKSSYETGNSIVAEETGFLKNIGVQGQEGLVQYGSYSYTDPDGHVITVRYTADEGGFRAEGDHLPTPPPVPAEVQKGLDIIFESIRQQAESKAQEKQLHNTNLESANYPAATQEDDGSYRPEYNL